METKHTPGPWRVGMRPGPIVYGPRGEQVTAMHDPLLERDKNMANARLIAAAPDLAELLILALPAVEEAEQFNKPHGPKLSTRIRAAVAKAGVL
jgi:hypothetical protein